MVNNFNFLKKFPKVGGTKFWPQKPRYREVRVIERRVIERFYCISNVAKNMYIYIVPY